MQDGGKEGELDNKSKQEKKMVNAILKMKTCDQQLHIPCPPAHDLTEQTSPSQPTLLHQLTVFLSQVQAFAQSGTASSRNNLKRKNVQSATGTNNVRSITHFSSLHYLSSPLSLSYIQKRTKRRNIPNLQRRITHK